MSTAQANIFPWRDEEAWSRWFGEFGGRLLLFARQQTRTEADAQDVLQEACVRIWKSRRKGGENADGRALFRLAFTAIRHAAIDLARKNKRRQRREDAATGDDSDIVWFDNRLESKERNDALQEALRLLPRKQREIIALKIWGDMTFAEIAETLEISQNTAASRYRYGLKALRNHLTRFQK